MPFRPFTYRLLLARREAERAQAEADRQWRERVLQAIQEAKAKRALNETRGRVGGWS